MGPRYGAAEVMVVAALRTELFFVRGPKAALGMGKTCQDGLRRVLERRTPRALALVGYCGTTVKGLRPGTLILADQILGPAGKVVLDEEILAKAKELLPEAQVGPLFTYPELLKKEKLREMVGLGEPEPLGIDMESYFVAFELRQRGMPFLMARVVLDAAEEEVSLGITRFLWAPRALWCSWILGRAAPKLREALKAYA